MPSSVTITVECPVVLLNANTSFRDVPDFTLESLITKPALCFLRDKPLLLDLLLIVNHI